VLQYVGPDNFADMTIAVPEVLSWVNERRPTWLLQQLESVSRYVDSRLRKRYAVPFDPAPEIVKIWVVAIVTLRLYLFRGIAPTDALAQAAKADADRAYLELAEAADAAEGLFELPLLEAQDGTATTKAATLAYSEASPYVARDAQAVAGRIDDERGSGG
jgi:phage gp36-like protein